ncbi:DUF5671 domain-containing protein [Agromyces albus]|uniref:DUF5671 domain-containing protein n=1 Tax=Agromyces albus TaxID=205332 RepID=A0A4Q2L6A9_9MICO|nr:DUF5671 domain-containing protein [Agromyces albus]RXZ71751.1 hypothetical protein ESP51_07605 [Agromyces albus]
MTATTLPAAPGPGPGPSPVTGSAQRTVRRLIVYSLLFVLVTIAAIGLSGLVGRLLETGTPLAAGGNAGLALSLAFTLIGGPLAALLWWVVWRRLTDDSERSSLAWGLYLALMYTVSLIVATSALVGTLSSLVSDGWRPGDFSTGVVWALVWAWHRWMWRHPAKGPIRLATVPAVAASVYGLIIGIGGGVTALGSLFDTAIRRASEQVFAGTTWWQAPLESLIWAVAGGAIWAWHWFRDDARRLDAGLARVALVVVGVLWAGFVMLAGLGTVLFVLLRLAFDSSDPASEILRPLGMALAAASVGALVWVYHRGVVARHSAGTRRAGALVMSGLGLVAAASGIGVVINATLAALVSPIAASDTRSLLLGGISALVVGGPVWWLNWKPARRVEATEAGSTGRRVYLIAVFGISAIVALITVLVVGYLLFEFGLDPTTTASLVDKVRAPFGLLVATGLVFGYHFALWRRDRSVIAAEGLAPARRIGRVILVTSGDAVALEQAITDATGASVTVWRSLDEPGVGPDAAALAGALEGVTGKRVLMLAGPGNRVEVVRLAD